MKKGLSIKILLLVASIFSSQLANAYCFYIRGDSQGSIRVLVYKNKGDFDTTNIANNIIDQAKKIGPAVLAMAGLPETGASIPVVGNFISEAISSVIRKTHHNLVPGATANAKDVCWGWTDIKRDVFGGNADKGTEMYFAAFDEVKKTFIGKGFLPIGGWVKITIMPDGVGAFTVWTADGRVRTTTANWTFSVAP